MRYLVPSLPKAADPARDLCERLLSEAGVAPGELRVLNPAFYARVLAEGTLGLGESYMDGWWECDSLDELACRALAAGVHERLRFSLRGAATAVWARLANRQRASRSARDVRAHYDAGNDLFEAMLDRRMTYSCGYWRDARTLDEAQEAKLDLVCRKIGLKAGDRVLDIGCGWGSFAAFAAERRGARVVGLTVSKAQAELARERCRGLDVEILLRDYREARGRYDHVVSIGMFEHVGPKNYRTFMRVVRDRLKPGGLCLLHTIGSRTSNARIEPWMDRYIFPGAVLPSLAQISRAAEGLLVVEDVHNFGPDYDRTLMAWHEKLERAWPSLDARYDPRFRRMWRYYLLFCAGTFRARMNQLWQIVLSPHGVPGGWRTVR